MTRGRPSSLFSQVAALLVPAAALLLMASASAGTLDPNAPDSTNSSRLSCPQLLMEGECREYLAQMQAATGASQREAVQQRYAPLLRERARLCHSASGGSCTEVIITPRLMSLPIPGKRFAL